MSQRSGAVCPSRPGRCRVEPFPCTGGATAAAGGYGAARGGGACKSAALAPLAAGVDAGSLNGLMVPWAAPRAGPDALDPPRGGRAAPPPGPLAACQGDEIP